MSLFDYRGVSDPIAYIMNVYATTPVFHGYRGITDNKDMSICGKVLWNGRPHAVILPRFHAEKFAVPCKVCFPAAGEAE